MKTKSVNAWLIMWKSFGKDVENPYVDILSGKKGEAYVRDHVQRLHDALNVSLDQRFAAVQYNRPTPTDYVAILSQSKEGPIIQCGHNPCLEARRVRILAIEIDESTDSEIVRWDPYAPSISN